MLERFDEDRCSAKKKLLLGISQYSFFSVFKSPFKPSNRPVSMSLLFTHPGQTVFPLAVAYFLTMVTSLSRTGTERNSFAVGETCANDVCAGQNANFGPLLRFVLVDFFSELKELQ